MKRSLTFLRADVPLTKTITPSGAKPYPMVANFTSDQYVFETIEELCEAIKLIGTAGGTLLKGHLTQKIEKAPRRGLHDTGQSTSWLVLDYDDFVGFEDFDTLLKSIDPRLAEVDYIFQHSASAGINGPAGLRGHAFFLLDEPVSPAVLKQWMIKLNLGVPGLRSRVTLSKNGMALCYPLDVTVNQNDKLIYIAPPVLEGIEDPIKNRLELRKRSKRTYSFSSAISVAVNKQRSEELLSELQDRMGLPARTPKYQQVGSDEVLLNPQICSVTSMQKSGDFIRVNLNGGDSFGYWHWANDAEILYNFKGEPPVFLKEVAPDYYQQVQDKKAPTKQVNIRPFVFHERLTDTMYSAEYDEVTDRLVSMHKVASRKTLQEFMQQRGKAPPRIVPDWEVTFDPTSHKQVDFDRKWINQFTPADMFLNIIRSPDIKGASPKDFPLIEHTLRHICVDEETYEHFVNWVAHIVKYRTKTQTAWIFSGTEGTGKGSFFHQVLVPIFGPKHCQLINNDTLEDKFNEFLRTNLITFLDEGDIASSKQADAIMAKLRSTITDPVVRIRAMRTDSFEIPNFTNLIIATNKSLPVHITGGDRRYNIAPRQQSKIEYPPEQYDRIRLEVPAFLHWLMARDISEKYMIGRLLKNDTKAEMLQLSRTVSEEFIECLIQGDLDFFTDSLLKKVPIPDNGYFAFRDVITEWMRTAGSPIFVTVEDLLNVYRYIGGRQDFTAKKLGHVAGRHGLTSCRKRIDGLLRTGYTVTFKPGDYSEWLAGPKNKSITIPIG